MRGGSAVLATVVVLLVGPLWAEPSSYPIAGTQPDQRLPGAPTINQLAKSKGWYQQALTGLQKPYPHSLRFLEDQGNWYTPFTRPGMTGPYDLRGWHRQR